MMIGAVSKQLGLPASTIRYYEKIGLIERIPRISGRRHFNNTDIFKLQFIQLAQAAGFTNAEAKQMLKKSNPSSSCNVWNEPGKHKRALIREKIEQLKMMEHILISLMQCQCVDLNTCLKTVGKQLRQAKN